MESSRHRVGVGDGARGEHGACDAHGTGSGGAHGMRGDAVGVGDIGEVPGDARGAGDTSAWGYCHSGQRQRVSGMVCGRRCYQPDSTGEPGRDRLGVGDGAWCRDGNSAAHC